MKILVTGSAGFIGSQLVCALASRGDDVVGIDNINDYYDVDLKYCRLKENGFEIDDGLKRGKCVQSRLFPQSHFIRLSIDELGKMDDLFAKEKFDCVVNLAAQAGVRYSITNPYSYLHSNLTGFLNILECCRRHQIKHLVFASSSSVYGLNTKVPYSEEDKVDTPISLYAATK